MLPLGLILEVRRLIDEDELSYRAIARKLGVGHATVNRIAHGLRRHRRWMSADDRAMGIPIRCRGCGGLVYEPCLLCRARAVRERADLIRRVVYTSRGRCKLLPSGASNVPESATG